MSTGMIQCGSLLFLVSLSMIMASVIFTEQERKIVLNRHARGADCTVDGTTHSDGANFTTTASGSCIIYQCNNGGYGPIVTKCAKTGGGCFDIDTTYVSSCTTYLCSQTNFPNGTTLLSTNIQSRQCQDKDGACHDVGKFFALNFGMNTWNCTCSISGYPADSSCRIIQP